MVWGVGCRVEGSGWEWLRVQGSRCRVQDFKVQGSATPCYRVTSLIRNCRLLGPYNRPMLRALGRSWGGGAIYYERGTSATHALHHSLEKAAWAACRQGKS